LYFSFKRLTTVVWSFGQLNGKMEEEKKKIDRLRFIIQADVGGAPVIQLFIGRKKKG